MVEFHLLLTFYTEKETRIYHRLTDVFPRHFRIQFTMISGGPDEYSGQDLYPCKYLEVINIEKFSPSCHVWPVDFRDNQRDNWLLTSLEQTTTVRHKSSIERTNIAESAKTTEMMGRFYSTTYKCYSIFQ